MYFVGYSPSHYARRWDRAVAHAVRLDAHPYRGLTGISLCGVGVKVLDLPWEAGSRHSNCRRCVAAAQPAKP